MRQVLAIHRSGSFARAAEDVGVAQPTLSKSIARLEDELGLKLFDRSGVGAKVTPMGALLVQRAETIISEAERLRRDIELVASGQIGEARIGFGPALRIFLPRFAEALATRRPTLRLELDVERRERVVEKLRAGELDMAIVAQAGDFGDDYVQTEIMRDPIVAVAAPRHELAERDRISVAEFLRHPIASASRSSLLTLSASANGDVREDAIVVCNDDTTLRHLAKRGLVTLLANRQGVREDIERGDLVVLPLDWSASIVSVAVTTRAAAHAPILQEIVALAREIGESLAVR
jgi:DNA-binding transcriptional LysR family regulator